MGEGSLGSMGESNSRRGACQQVKTMIDSQTPEIVLRTLQSAVTDGDLASAVQKANLTLLPGTDILVRKLLAPSHSWPYP